MLSAANPGMTLSSCQNSILQKDKENIHTEQEKAALQDSTGYNTELDNGICSSLSWQEKKQTQLHLEYKQHIKCHPLAQRVSVFRDHKYQY